MNENVATIMKKENIRAKDGMIEEAYCEGRTLKASLSNKSKIENSNLLQNLK